MNDQPGTSSAIDHEEEVIERTRNEEEPTNLTGDPDNGEVPRFSTLWRMEREMERLVDKIGILLDLRIIEVRHRNRLQRNSHQYEKMDDTFYYEEISTEILEATNDTIKEISMEIRRKRAKIKLLEKRINEYKRAIEAENKENLLSIEQTETTN